MNSEKVCEESSVETVKYGGSWIVKQFRMVLKIKRQNRDSENVKTAVSGGIKNFKVCSFRMLILIMLSEEEGKNG